MTIWPIDGFGLNPSMDLFSLKRQSVGCRVVKPDLFS